MEHPLGYHKGGNDQVYKLKKALYGLRQAPRAWYSKIESYFNEEDFVKCPHEPILFVKHGSKCKIFIVSLYVYDLIYTSNDDELIEALKGSMRERFAMTDLGKMKYFLEIEVSHCNQGIFIY